MFSICGLCRAFKTRPSDGRVFASVRLLALKTRSIQALRSNVCKLTIDSFTYASGPSMAMSNFPRATLVKVLNPAPGNHSGRYLTSVNHQSGRTAISRDIGGLTNWESINEECAWNYRRSHDLGCFDYGSREFIFGRLYVEAICYIHYKRTDGTCERWRRMSFYSSETFRKTHNSV